MNKISRCQPLLGTYVEMHITGDETDDVLLDMSIAAFNEIEKVHQLMSFQDTESELSFINRTAAQSTCTVSREIYEVLTQAIQLSEMTAGLFDITVAQQLVNKGLLPDHGVTVDASACWKDILLMANQQVRFTKNLIIDLGGIAKGYAVDKAVAVLDGKVSACVNAGGDLRMTHWQDESVCIRHPANPNQVLELSMQNAAVATSASYYLDGKDAIVKLDAALGAPLDSALDKTQDEITASSRNSYSVFADKCMLADALTKIAFLSYQSEGCNHKAVFSQFNASVVQVDPLGRITQH